MAAMKIMRIGPSLSRVIVVTFVVSFALACVLNVAGQSGRRVKKTVPAPVAASQTTPAIEKPTEKPKPAVTLFVGMERPDYFVTPRANGAASVLLSVVDRLGDHPSVKVDMARSDMTQSEAIRRARSEKEAYVVFLKLATDSMRGSGEDTRVFVQYWVFSPTTAKLKTWGQTYPQTYRNSGVILNPRVPSIYGDYQLEQAGRDAADKILDAFKLNSPERRVPGQAGLADNSASW